MHAGFYRLEKEKHEFQLECDDLFNQLEIEERTRVWQKEIKLSYKLPIIIE